MYKQPKTFDDAKKLVASPAGYDQQWVSIAVAFEWPTVCSHLLART